LGLLYEKKGDKVAARKLYQQAKTETHDKNLLEKLKRKLKKRVRLSLI